MPPKRKATPIEPMSEDHTDAYDNPYSPDTQISDQTEVNPKRLKSALEPQELLGGNEDLIRKIGEDKNNVSARKHAPVKKAKDAESQSTRPMARRSRCTELKADIIKSREQERQRAEQAEASFERLKSKIKELSSRSEQQVEKIKRLEISKLAASGQDRVYFQDDDTIRGNVALLFDKISTWALNWAHEDYFILHMKEADANTTIEMLQGRSRHLETRLLRERADSKCAWATAGCRLATEAFLATMIAKLFLARPLEIPIQSTSGRYTSMEEYVRRVRDGMKSTQVETHLWASITLRSHYSPDQYADSIFKSITNDHFQQARMSKYESVISQWISEKDSPLTPLLKPCHETNAKQRRAGLLKIFHAASKLSLQLWVQDSEVEVIDNMRDQNGILRLFNDIVAEMHALTPDLPTDFVTHDREVDLLVWPRIQVTRFNSMHSGTPHRISTKASVVIFDLKVCRDNKAEYENRINLSSNATVIEAPIQKEPADQDLKDVATEVNGEIGEIIAPASGEYVKETDEGSHQLHKEPTDAATQTIQKDLDVDMLVAESDASATNQLNARESSATRSRNQDRTIIDLTDESTEESTTRPSAEKCQESQKAAPQERSQDGESSTTVLTAEFLLPGLAEAASMCSEPKTPRSEEYQTQTQSSQAPDSEKNEQAANRDSQAERHAQEQLSPDKTSKAGSAEPQQSQVQEDQSKLANMYQFVDSDPAIEEFNQPLNLQGFGNGAEIFQEIGRRESLTRNMTWNRSDDGFTVEVVDSMSAIDQDDDTIMVVIPEEPVALVEKQQEEVNGDPKPDPQNDTDIDAKMVTGNAGVNEGQDDTGDPDEPAVDKIGGGEGQDDIGETTDSATKDT